MCVELTSAGSRTDAVLGGAESACRRGVDRDACGSSGDGQALEVFYTAREATLTRILQRKHRLNNCLADFVFTDEVLEMNDVKGREFP
jgi:hypothetical protein